MLQIPCLERGKVQATVNLSTALAAFVTKALEKKTERLRCSIDTAGCILIEIGNPWLPYQRTSLRS